MGASMASNLQAAGHELHRQRRAQGSGGAASRRGRGAGRTRRARSPRTRRSSSPRSPARPRWKRWRWARDGLISGMQRGAAYFDLSTNSPGLVRRLHAAFAEKGVHLLDAPVSGGPEGAKSRKLALWIGGDARGVRPLQAGAGRHRRPGVLRGPDRRRLGGQARAQLRGLRHPDRPGRGLHDGRQGRRRSARAVAGGAAGRAAAAGAPSTASSTSSCPAPSIRPPSR